MEIIKIVRKRGSILYIGPFQTSIIATNHLKSRGYELKPGLNVWRKIGYAHDQGDEKVLIAEATLQLLHEPTTNDGEF